MNKFKKTETTKPICYQRKPNEKKLVICNFTLRRMNLWTTSPSGVETENDTREPKNRTEWQNYTVAEVCIPVDIMFIPWVFRLCCVYGAGATNQGRQQCCRIWSVSWAQCMVLLHYWVACRHGHGHGSHDHMWMNTDSMVPTRPRLRSLNYGRNSHVNTKLYQNQRYSLLAC